MEFEGTECEGCVWKSPECKHRNLRYRLRTAAPKVDVEAGKATERPRLGVVTYCEGYSPLSEIKNLPEWQQKKIDEAIHTLEEGCKAPAIELYSYVQEALEELKQ